MEKTIEHIEAEKLCKIIQGRLDEAEEQIRELSNDKDSLEEENKELKEGIEDLVWRGEKLLK